LEQLKQSKYNTELSDTTVIQLLAINFLWPPGTNQIYIICSRQPQVTDKVCLPDKLAIFMTSSAHYVHYSSRYSVSDSYVFRGEIISMVYLTNFSMVAWTWPKYAVFVPYHWPVSNSAKFCENTEIPRKRANSAAQLKIPSSLIIMIMRCPSNQRW